MTWPSFQFIHMSQFCIFTLILGSVVINENVRLTSAVPPNKKVLVVAPNSFAGHFTLQRKLVEILVEQDWVHHVHMLIIEDPSLEGDRSMLPGPKLKLKYYPYNTHKKQPLFTGLWLREWYRREEPRSNHMCIPGAKYEEHQLLEFAKKEKKLVQALRVQHFDIGIAEAWDYAAFPLLRLIGVRHIVATLSMPISSIFYDIMDSQYLQKIIDQGDIPELWTTMCDDHLKIDAADIFGPMHMENVQGANEVYANMDERFAEIYENCRKKRESKKANTFSGGNMLNKLLGKPPAEPIPTYQPFRELFRESAHFFVNTQPFLDFPMPPGIPQKIAFIGGIKFSTNNIFGTSSIKSPLGDIEQSMENKAGLILVCFGSMIKFEEMPPDKKNALLETFRDEFPNFLFIVKSAKNYHEFGGNIISKQWVPQMELLASNHIKLFISHCGMNSVLEAAHHGVPLLCVPLLADQFYNAEAMAKRGAAVVLSKDLIEERDVIRAQMHEALQDRYKHGMRKIQGQMAEIKPLEEFLEKIHALT